MQPCEEEFQCARVGWRCMLSRRHPRETKLAAAKHKSRFSVRSNTRTSRRRRKEPNNGRINPAILNDSSLFAVQSLISRLLRVYLQRKLCVRRLVTALIIDTAVRLLCVEVQRAITDSVKCHPSSPLSALICMADQSTHYN